MHSREAIQKQMSGQKSQQCTQSSPRPDGDVELPEEYIAAMRVPSCSDCKGVIMPDVVFFGGTVPKPRVESCMDAVARADGLLVIGSSLQVFSGFRFCRRAAELGKPIAIINPGTTRADDIAQLKLKSDCGPLLERVASQRAALC
jgi:NAD-dependent SIR2 family protein deacetylase